jgi:hypothetical protein
VDRAVSDSVERQFRSVFPEGTFTQVDVLGYGDDPDVEPGEIAVRAFIDRAGQPAESFEDDEKVLHAFEAAHREEVKKLHQAGVLPAVAWVHLIPDTRARRAQRGTLYGFPSFSLGMRSDPADGAAGFAAVRAHLGPDDLATVDALITAGIGSSRAEVIRWAIGRIRQNPSYAQLQDRLREIGELKSQF